MSTEARAPEADGGVLAGLIRTLRAAGCVFAEDEAALLMSAAATPAELATMVQERLAGQPLEPIIGWAEFAGLRVAVEPGVFVPRRRTEFMVQQAVQHEVRRRRMAGATGTVVLDLCCGTGAIGLAVAGALGPHRVELHAADIEEPAVRCARQNLEPVGGTVLLGDLFQPLPASLRGRVDLLLVNAPYVPTSEIALMPREARLHEPRITLDGGPDGLDVHRRVAGEALDWLAPGGAVLIETGARQATGTAEALSRSGLSAEVRHSIDGEGTVVLAT